MTPKRFLLIIAIAALIIAGGVGYYFWSHDTFDARTPNVADDTVLSDEDVAEIIKAAGKHIILPEGEEPAAAKIIDVDELLKTQPFYRGAINGDILLIYQASAKAILYSPSRDMLVNVGPIVGEDGTETAPIDAEVSDETTEDAQ